MKNKKIALGVTAALFLGSTVGFAAGVGFFDNATTVEQNIYKLANIATQNKQKATDVQSKLDQTTSQQKNLQDQLDSLKQQLANKTRSMRSSLKSKPNNVKSNLSNRKSRRNSKRRISYVTIYLMFKMIQHKKTHAWLS